MKSLTATVFLDIFRSKGGEILQHIGELPMHRLYEFHSQITNVITEKQTVLVDTINREIEEKVLLWKEICPVKTINHGKASVEKCYELGIYLNIHDYELIVLGISPDGKIRTRKNTLSREWDTYNSFSYEIFTDRYDTPWIQEFAEYIETVYYRWTT